MAPILLTTTAIRSGATHRRIIGPPNFRVARAQDRAMATLESAGRGGGPAHGSASNLRRSQWNIPCAISYAEGASPKRGETSSVV